MKWKDIKLSNKFTTAFGITILLLTVVVLWAIIGIDGIRRDADGVIIGNKLRTGLTQKHVDHLLWAAKTNKFFTNKNIKHLYIETNHNKSAFGEWYYSKGRAGDEKIAPELKELFDEI